MLLAAAYLNRVVLRGLYSGAGRDQPRRQSSRSTVLEESRGLRSHVMRFHVECSGFGYQAEFLTRLISEGATFKEIPLIAYDREGSAAMSVKNLLSVTHSLITIALRRLRIVLFE